MEGPLSGIKVLDLTRLLSGPFCTMLLADLGADIIKVERPGMGDTARNLGPLVGDQAAYFISINRGKKSITINLFSEEGKQVVRSLLGDSDILVENFVPGTMERFGLDYENIRGDYPKLIYASISGFGQDGPEAQRPALDIVVQAMGGLISLTGQPDGSLVRPGVSLGDSVAGIFTALAIVSALYQRGNNGLGQYIDMSMLDCQIMMVENALSRYFATGDVPGPIGARHPVAAPFQIFKAKDRDFVIAILTDDPSVWHRFCEAINEHDLAKDERFQGNRGRMDNYEDLAPLLEKIFSNGNADYWLDLLTQAGIPCGPVNDIAAVANHPQVKHRGMIAKIPEQSQGDWWVANSPFKFGDYETGPAGPSPLLGEHTLEILRESAGMSDHDIQRLKDIGAI